MDFAKNLRALRQQQQLTQIQVAKKLHVSRQTVSSWENERSYPDIETLIQISNTYQVSLDELLKGDVGMVKHYQQQAAVSQRDARITVLSFYATALLLFLSYFLGMMGWSDFPLIEWLPFIIFAATLVLTTHYQSFNGWFSTPRKRYESIALAVVVIALNVAYAVTMQNIPVLHLPGYSTAYVLGYDFGIVTGLTLYSYSAFLVIKIMITRGDA
ncbi:helix-turn-helix domain-containing protein [Lactiplantibacillus fabifermentans]|nr:helix-turn-helix transcriptional regulator [Lactiplantibacillus fabifermentans]ETY73277.1 XRE family transcriptional regulator [Lactiplantibacillus fabifermentans T30PCM01]